MEKEIRHYVAHYWYYGVLDAGNFEIYSKEDYLENFSFNNVPQFVGLRFYDREITGNKGYIELGDAFNFSPFIKVMKAAKDEDLKAWDKSIDSIVSFEDYKKEVLGESRIKR